MKGQAEEEMKLKEHSFKVLRGGYAMPRKRHEDFRALVRKAVAKWHVKANHLRLVANNAKQKKEIAEKLLQRSQLERELQSVSWVACTHCGLLRICHPFLGL